MKARLLASMLLAGLFGTATAQAATVVPVNLDPAGQGLNDPTARAAEGGNPGATVGKQRMIAYQFAADLWGSVLKPTVDVRVGASFQPLPCSATGGVLGSAGPWWVNSDFANAPLAQTTYHAALANSLAGTNLNAVFPDYVFPDDIEINSRFNANLGTPGCLTGSGWYYGLDGNTPAGKINFLDVVMHEIGHGLGVSGFLDKTTGELADFGFGPQSDVYTHFAYDNQSNKTFDDPTMTDALRAQTMKTPGRLVWSGGQVTAEAPSFLAPGTVLRVSAPAAVARDYEYGTAGFGPAATPGNYSGQIVQGVPTDGCTAITSAVAGKIALISRGACGFATKTKNAQNAGAIAVLIANNQVGGAIGMGGADATITIPTLSVSQGDGASLAANLPATIALLSGAGLEGADSSGRVRLYAPEVVAGGSTFSHYDNKLTPNALMEPAINDSLAANFDVDLTTAMFKDQGWGVATGNATLAGCDTTVPVVDSGLILGANIQAQGNLCLAQAAGSRSTYLRCMSDHAYKLYKQALITPSQFSKVRACATTVRP